MKTKNLAQLSVLIIGSFTLVACSGANFLGSGDSSNSTSAASTATTTPPVVQDQKGMLRCNGTGGDYMGFYIEVAKTATGFDMTQASIYVANVPQGLEMNQVAIGVFAGTANADNTITSTPISFRLFDTKLKTFLNGGKTYTVVYRSDIPALLSDSYVLTSLDSGRISFIVDLSTGVRPDVLSLKQIPLAGSQMLPETDTALLPPFAANPINYSNNGTRSSALTRIHPFATLPGPSSVNWTGVEEDFCVY